MQTQRMRARAGALGAALLPAALLVACASEPKLTSPSVLYSPWPGERTWAVVPFANESGVSTVDTMALSDAFAAEIDGVEGIDCLPVNRTISGMRAAKLGAVRSEADARLLLNVLGADGLVVGTVTAFDPYRPLELGVAAQVFTEARSTDSTSPDLATMTMATSESRNSPNAERSGPSSQFSRVYRANNHDVMALVASYASGRTDFKSGMGPSTYLTTMSAYERFVAYDVTRQLLNQERWNAQPTEDKGPSQSARVNAGSSSP